MLILPGKYVGISEEYLPGFGVYSDDGKLYASNIGELELDPKEHVAKVTVKTRIPKMQAPGTITVGMVADVSEQKAIVDLIPFNSENFTFVPQAISAILHVSKVKRGFLKDMRTELKSGDILRVKIIEVNKHTVELAIDEGKLGVIKAFCSKCRHKLSKKEYKLVCEKCGNTETRKMAYDYGSGMLM